MTAVTRADSQRRHLASARTVQGGMTLISFLLLLGFLGLCAVVLVRVAPIYFEHYMIRSTLQSLESDRDLGNKSREEIFDLLRRRWEINNVEDVTTGNVKLERDDKNLKLRLQYDVVRHVLGNLDVVARFDDVVVIELKP
ncbi:DUF4845 domain-containing protein [Methylolobus aquaticus]